MHMHNPPHPGEVLKELYIKPLHLTIAEIAKGIGVTRKSLSELVNGKYGVSPDMAVRLSKAFSTTPESWLTLQQQYDLWKVTKKHKWPRIKVFVHATAHSR
jgi:addiction module HigA family antidote